MTGDGSADGPRAVAHDLNNLLTAIIAAADAVLARPGIDSDTQDDIAQIRDGARRGAMLVRRFRGESCDMPELVSINAAIGKTSRLLERRLGATIAFSVELCEPDERVMIDPVQLDRILLNLVSNAGQAMPNGGRVVLRTGRRTVAAVEARVPDAINPGDYLVISIADSGVGISNDRMSRIFDAGFTSRAVVGGSGLGLSSIRDMVGRANGFVTVESIEGEGSCFEVYLPRIACVSPPVTPATVSEILGRTVLLVDDDVLVRSVVQKILVRAEWTVLLAESAEEALDILHGSTVDLMISDIAMPGMDGLALARIALTKQADLPVILVSGYEQNVTDHGFGVGNVSFLAKPYGQKELLATVARAVPGRATGA